MSSEECIIQYSVHESLEIILVECTRIFCSQKIIILGSVSDWSPFVCVFQATAVQGEKHSLTTDYLMKILGLDICADTVVGSEMLRGISGGQRKRVTTGEFFASRSCKTFVDNQETQLR